MVPLTFGEALPLASNSAAGELLRSPAAPAAPLPPPARRRCGWWSGSHCGMGGLGGAPCSGQSTAPTSCLAGQRGSASTAAHCQGMEGGAPHTCITNVILDGIQIMLALSPRPGSVQAPLDPSPAHRLPAPHSLLAPPFPSPPHHPP